MATLVLMTVGTLVGGPVGGAVGALIGQAADAALLAPAGRRGPRLGDLAVQTSSYGTAIPKLFGRMRVAGTVIWATDLKETATRSGGGKGRARTTQYSYSASFAVALSARRLRSVGRIWADGTLLRGAGGDWKAATGFRFHDGAEGQAVDPLIAAVEGATPAYRGIAYVVFEDMALAPYGNRIPSLSFEVEADDAPVGVGAIAAVLSDGRIADATRTRLIGYAAGGDSVRGAIETLASAVPVTLADHGDALVLEEDAGAAILIPDDAAGAAAGERGGARRQVDRRAAGTVPGMVSIAYYEVGRDYQAGLQAARRRGPGRRAQAVDLPAVLDAAGARALAERRLAADWAGRATAVVRLPWRWMAIRPGQAVALPGDPTTWRVAGVTIERMVVELRLAGCDGTAPVAARSAAGRVLAQADRPHGATTIALFELPPGGGAAETAPRLHVAAAGVSDGWRQAMLEVAGDDGSTIVPAGRTAPPAIMGRVVGTAAAAGHATFDDATTIEVALLNDAMTLEGRSDAAMLAGANLALVGDELIQFGRVEQLGVARFRIGRLLRGRRGTEAAIATHGLDERFVLIEADRLAVVALPMEAVGATVRIAAQGIGDAAPVEAAISVEGAAIRPPSPVHLRAARLPGGDVAIGWTRRSRGGWAWSDSADAPLGEEAEAYRLTIARADGGVRTVTVDAPEWLYPAAMRAADGHGNGDAITIGVAQLGTLAASPVATATIAL